MGSAATVFSGWMHTGRIGLATWWWLVGVCGACGVWLCCKQNDAPVRIGVRAGVCVGALLGVWGGTVVCSLVACVLLVVFVGCWWCVGVVCENWIVDASMTDAALLLLLWWWCGVGV